MTLASRLTIPALLGAVIALAATGLLVPQVHASSSRAETIAQVTGVPLQQVLNMRSAPQGDAERVGTLSRNAFVWVESCTGEWCLVERSGMKGWVSARYLTPREG